MLDFTKDVDDGLELNEAFTAELEESIKALDAGQPAVPAEEVTQRHGLLW